MSNEDRGSGGEGPPVLLAADAESAAHAVARLRAAGWTVRRGFALPENPWDLSAARLACHGTLDTEEEARSAILAAARGTGLVIVDTPSTLTYLDDLLHVGHLEWIDDATVPGPSGTDAIAADQRRLLELLAAGRLVAEAARECHLSTRTAQRRLAAARAILGAPTNRAAVVELARRDKAAER